jgi:hypothetical protein
MPGDEMAAKLTTRSNEPLLCVKASRTYAARPMRASMATMYAMRSARSIKPQPEAPEALRLSRHGWLAGPPLLLPRGASGLA